RTKDEAFARWKNPLRGFVGLEGTDAGGFRQLPCRVQFELDELEKLWSLKSLFDKWKWILLGESQINYSALFFCSTHCVNRDCSNLRWKRHFGVFRGRIPGAGTGGRFGVRSTAR
ncbi:MAG: hypothetical protein RSA54_13175, partial [Glutamicibacter sp.]